MASFVAALALVAAAPKALGQSVPLAEKRFDYNALPYQVDTDNGDRGRQFGYNICNSTTEGPESLCQTAIINSLEDFCLWGPPEKDSLIGNTEGEAIAWCTKPGYGTRVIPEGALTGVQFMRTPDYIQVVGHIDQKLINIETNDSGGEMDPHGADQRGNPLGGLIFSNAYNGQMTQVVEWHNFMGGNTFCLKACDPAGPNAAHFCEHVFDRTGCLYNAPAAYEEIKGQFLSCAGDSQDFPGIYTDEAGAVQTYTQPPESLGAIQTMPYQPKVPSSSECKTFESASIYNGAPSNTANEPEPTGSESRTGSRSSTRSSTRSGSASNSESTDSAESSASGLDAGVFGSMAAVVAASLMAAFMI